MKHSWSDVNHRKTGIRSITTIPLQYLILLLSPYPQCPCHYFKELLFILLGFFTAIVFILSSTLTISALNFGAHTLYIHTH